jgi:predicted peptidase
MISMAVGSTLAFLIIGAQFASQSIGAIVWKNNEPERTRRLAEPFEARTFIAGDGQELLYRFMRPMDYDSTKQYPIVVCLHHGGTHGNDNIKQVEGSPVAQLLSTQENRTKYPAFLFVPQCPEGTGWGGVAALPSVDSLVFEALAAFEDEFSIDEKRRYVTGNSGGGYGSWHFICTRPELFAASIPICGGADPKLATKIVDVPVWVFHGENDRNVPVRFSRDMVSAIEAAGGHPKYTELAGAGHNIWPQVNATPGLMDWLFAQRRD